MYDINEVEIQVGQTVNMIEFLNPEAFTGHVREIDAPNGMVLVELEDRRYDELVEKIWVTASEVEVIVA